MRPHLFFLVALAVAPASAETAIWIDLAGEWRTAPGDRSEYAQPAFDDSSWKTVQLPTRRLPGEGMLWLRRSLSLPAGAAGQTLWLTLGIPAHRYQVFLNGRLVGELNWTGEPSFRRHAALRFHPTRGRPGRRSWPSGRGRPSHCTRSGLWLTRDLTC